MGTCGYETIGHEWARYAWRQSLRPPYINAHAPGCEMDSLAIYRLSGRAKEESLIDKPFSG